MNCLTRALKIEKKLFSKFSVPPTPKDDGFRCTSESKIQAMERKRKILTQHKVGLGGKHRRIGPMFGEVI